MSRFDQLVPVKREDMSRICKDMGTTIPKLAKAVGCSPSTIYAYLNRVQIPKVLLDQICGVIFGKNEKPKKNPEPVFPIYTKDILLAKFYLTRAIEKMDEMYLKGGLQKNDE